jgi:transposase-like protein
MMVAMPKIYSEDFRLQVVKCVKRGKSYEKICEFFNIGIATLYRWISMHKKKQSVSPTKRSIYKANKISFNKLIELVEQHPDATLTELASHFNCSFQTIDYWLRKLCITRKKNNTLRRERREKA